MEVQLQMQSRPLCEKRGCHCQDDNGNFQLLAAVRQVIIQFWWLDATYECGLNFQIACFFPTSSDLPFYVPCVVISPSCACLYICITAVNDYLLISGTS